MTRALWAAGLVVLIAGPAAGQAVDIRIPPPSRSPYTLGGYLEARPALVWFDPDSALFKVRSPETATAGARARQFQSRLQLDAGYRRGWLSAQTRTVADVRHANAEWNATLTAYEAFVSVKPAPSLTVDLGKRTLKWGKGYIWNPAAFLDRQKSPEDPALALEGAVVVSADYIRTFDGPLQVASLTPVLLPVAEGLNEHFGQTGHLNAAARLYLLLWDTDIDVMWMGGGSRPGRVGFDLSRNLRSNIEVHGEWAHIPRAATPVLQEDGVLVEQRHGATSAVVGARILTSQNTTVIVDYFRNGLGYRREEMAAYFDLVTRGHQAFEDTGDRRLLSSAGMATAAGYGQLTPMRNYVYGRVTQPDAWGVLYLMLGASAIVNLDDRSYTILPEVQHKPVENLEVRWLMNIQRGGTGTDFGERQADVRIEVRARYYF
ncbi:MAG: hypothetical protein Q8L86_19365 [Vicinamibacterales bacterium]|nr:hypothetical protein [Vicinamibacterales bacterium]